MSDLLPHVLLLYREMIPSVLLCGYVQMQELAEEGIIHFRSGKPMSVSVEDLQWADTVIAVRLDNPYEVSLLTLLKACGKQIVYVMDDDLLQVPEFCSSFLYYRRPEISDSIRALIRLSDGVLSPSPRLLEKYCREGQRGFLIEEPALYPTPYLPHESGPVKIGFAGSIDRASDLNALLSDTLLMLKEKYQGRVQFEFFGIRPAVADQLGAVVIPFQDSYEIYRETLDQRQWDIGLAPMPDTPFHRCKHYNKFCEYAASGILGVYSAVEPYTRLPSRFQGVILCENTPESWFAALKELIEDGERRERLRQQVSALAHGSLSVRGVAETMDKEFLRFLERRVSGRVSAAKVLSLRLGCLLRKGGRALLTDPRGLVKKVLSRLRGENTEKT